MTGQEIMRIAEAARNAKVLFDANEWVWIDAESVDGIPSEEEIAQKFIGLIDNLSDVTDTSTGTGRLHVTKFENEDGSHDYTLYLDLGTIFGDAS